MPVERRRDRLLPLRARRRERDDLVLAGRGLGETRQRPADVVADPRRADARAARRRTRSSRPVGRSGRSAMPSRAGPGSRRGHHASVPRSVDLEAHDALAARRTERNAQPACVDRGSTSTRSIDRRRRARTRSVCGASNSAGSLCTSTSACRRAAEARVRDALAPTTCPADRARRRTRPGAAGRRRDRARALPVLADDACRRTPPVASVST